MFRFLVFTKWLSTFHLSESFGNTSMVGPGHTLSEHLEKDPLTPNEFLIYDGSN